jgi:hypothetical protein
MSKFQDQVLKRYPAAYAEYGEDGVRIMNGEEFLAEEYFMPDTFDEDTAWQYAAMACKVTQNFNRTHPLRLDLSHIEEKTDRINARKHKSHVQKLKKDVI